MQSFSNRTNAFQETAPSYFTKQFQHDGVASFRIKKVQKKMTETFSGEFSRGKKQMFSSTYDHINFSDQKMVMFQEFD